MNRRLAGMLSGLIIAAASPICAALTVKVNEGVLYDLANVRLVSQGQPLEIDGDSAKYLFVLTDKSTVYIKELDVTIEFRNSSVCFGVHGNKIGFFDPSALGSKLPTGIVIHTGSKDVQVAIIGKDLVEGSAQVIHANNKMKVDYVAESGNSQGHYSLTSIYVEGNPFTTNGGDLFAAWARVLEVNNNLDFEGNPINLGDTKLGPLTFPWAGAVAADIHATAADANIALDEVGALTAFQLDSFPGDGGSTTAAAVCKSSECTDASTIRWGAWGQGSAVLSGMSFAVAPTSQLHYIIGNATAPGVINDRRGTVSYAHIGGTTPTGAGGTTYNATVGNMSVNFTAATATLSQYTLKPTLSPSTVTYDFRNVPLTMATSGHTKTLGGFATSVSPGPTTGTLAVGGFFAGATGQYIGAAMNVTDGSNPAVSINSVQAFKQQ